jgi:hypothetical protein
MNILLTSELQLFEMLLGLGIMSSKLIIEKTKICHYFEERRSCVHRVVQATTL